MKKYMRLFIFSLAFSLLGYVNVMGTDPSDSELISCGATYGTVKDLSQNGVGGMTVRLEKFNVLLGGYILDQTDVTDSGTGFYSFVIVNGCGTYKVRPIGFGDGRAFDNKPYIHEYVDNDSIFADQDFIYDYL